MRVDEGRGIEQLSLFQRLFSVIINKMYAESAVL